MQFRRTRSKADSEERILPLINVVFLLLVFFMLAGRLTQSAPFEVAPPQSAEAAALQAAEDTSAAPTLLLAADGRLSLDGVVLDRAALQPALAERRSPNPHKLLRLKADAAAEATQVVAVMEMLRDAGIERLELFAQPLQGAADR